MLQRLFKESIVAVHILLWCDLTIFVCKLFLSCGIRRRVLSVLCLCCQGFWWFMVRSRLQFLEVSAPGLDLNTPDLLMGSFFVNIRACTCMYAITRILPEFKSVSSSHVSRPLVRIAAAPGGLSRNRGADQVTRTTRVANATSTTFAPGSYWFICCGEESRKCNNCGCFPHPSE